MKKKGGLADSPFFKSPKTELPQSHLIRGTKQAKPKTKSPRPNKQTSLNTHRPQRAKNTKPVIPRHRDTMQPSNHDTVIPRNRDTIIESVRKAVMKIGKEAATHRFTVDEKNAIADIIYSYKRQDIKTSENEITRIAINFLISDYEENGENSVLHQAIKALTT